MKVGNICIVGFCVKPQAQGISNSICRVPAGFRPSSQVTCIEASAFTDVLDKNYVMNGFVIMGTDGNVYQSYGSSQFTGDEPRFSALFIYSV